MPPISTKKNKTSPLLTTEENNEILTLLEGSRSASTAVVQLFSTDPPSHSQWNKKHVGVLCFVKDSHLKTYFFRLFCLTRNAMVWEHQVYNNIDYVQPLWYFHFFEGKEGIIAFNFASNDEGRKFGIVVEERIKICKMRGKKSTPERSGSVQVGNLKRFFEENGLLEKHSGGVAMLPRPKGQEKQESQTCMICWNGVAEFVHVPCGHFGVCEGCKVAMEARHMRCAACRSNISGNVKIFFMTNK